MNEYITHLVNEKGFEAHRCFADIQFTLNGIKLVRCKPLEQVKELIPYNEEKDAARLAHEPCLAVDGKQEVVKFMRPEDVR